MTELAAINRVAVILLPTQACLDWTNSCPGGDDPNMTLEEMEKEPTVFLIPDGKVDPESYIRRHYKAMFTEELNSWYTDPALWPKDLSFKNFKRFFTIQLSSVVFDIGPGQIEKD